MNGAACVNRMLKVSENSVVLNSLFDVCIVFDQRFTNHSNFITDTFYLELNAIWKPMCFKKLKRRNMDSSCSEMDI